MPIPRVEAAPVLPTRANEVMVVPKMVINSRNAPQVRLARKKSTAVCRQWPT